MRELDETDLQILELLAEDARRPYSDIAEAVELSGPAVSERISRLKEEGVIRRFTVDVDRSLLRAGVPVLLSLSLRPESLPDVRDTMCDADAVEHVFTTAESNLVCYARLESASVREWLLDTVDASLVDEYSVTLLSDASWTPSVGGTEFALKCAECGNTVTSEGETARIGGDRYHFCCSSCKSRFEEQYRRLEEGI